MAGDETFVYVMIIVRDWRLERPRNFHILDTKC